MFRILNTQNRTLNLIHSAQVQVHCSWFEIIRS